MTENNPLGAHDKTSPFGTLDDVKKANADAGQNWFSESTFAWWKTKIETGLIRGRYFITSEDPFDTGRKYAVRYARDDGHIDTVNPVGYPSTEGSNPWFESSAEAMDRILEHDQAQYRAETAETDTTTEQPESAGLPIDEQD